MVALESLQRARPDSWCRRLSGHAGFVRQAWAQRNLIICRLLLSHGSSMHRKASCAAACQSSTTQARHRQISRAQALTWTGASQSSMSQVAHRNLMTAYTNEQRSDRVYQICRPTQPLAMDVVYPCMHPRDHSSVTRASLRAAPKVVSSAQKEVHPFNGRPLGECLSVSIAVRQRLPQLTEFDSDRLLSGLESNLPNSFSW